MARVLGALRQSKTKERAVSIPAQRRAIERWAEANGHEVVKFTEDPSTSGKIPSFDRPELGPWLNDPDKIAAWDILVTLRIDRACRNTLDFLQLTKWSTNHGKTYVSLKENIDMSTAQGRQAARDAASRAEWEHDIISERVLDTRAELAEQGRWPGGRIAFGQRAEKREDGYYIVVDEDGTAPIARRMAADAIAGMSNAAIQRWLNAEGITTMIGKPWLVESVRQVLTSPNMAALLSEQDYAALQAALRSRKQVRGQWTSGKHYLLRVAYCHKNKTPLYAALKRKRSYGGYYRCVVCGMVVQIPTLESGIEADLRNIWGDQQYRIRRLIPGDDNAKEIAKLEKQLDLVQHVELVDVTPLEERIAELRAAPHKPDKVILEDTGITVVEHWDSLGTPAERNRFLRDRDVRYLVSPDGFEPWHIPAEWNPRHVVRA